MTTSVFPGAASRRSFPESTGAAWRTRPPRRTSFSRSPGTARASTTDWLSTSRPRKDNASTCPTCRSICSGSGLDQVACGSGGKAKFRFPLRIRQEQVGMRAEEFLDRFHRPGTELGPHRMPVDAAVFNHQIIAAPQERGQHLELAQHMCLAMVGVEDHEQCAALRRQCLRDARRGFRGTAAREHEFDARMLADLQRRVRNIDRDHLTRALGKLQKVGKEQCGAAVSAAGLDHPLDAALGENFLVVPEVARHLEGTDAAIVLALPYAEVVVLPEIFGPGEAVVVGGGHDAVSLGPAKEKIKGQAFGLPPRSARR